VHVQEGYQGAGNLPGGADIDLNLSGSYADASGQVHRVMITKAPPGSTVPQSWSWTAPQADGQRVIPATNGKAQLIRDGKHYNISGEVAPLSDPKTTVPFVVDADCP
jgi:hypothetical protein